MTSLTSDPRLAVMLEAASMAARLVLPMFERGIASKQKADGTIVTEADTAAEALISAHLRAVYPHTPILGEEAVASGHCPNLETNSDAGWFCVDPIDGTRQFANNDPEWTICIGYVEHGVPVSGVLVCPAYGRSFAGTVGLGAFEIELDGRHTPLPRDITLSPIAPTADAPEQTVRVLRGGNDTQEAVLALLPAGPDSPTYSITRISAALKFGLVAAGEADLFARAGRVWDWDIVAGAAVLSAAGGRVSDVQGRPLVFGNQINGYQHPPFFAQGRRLVELGLLGSQTE
jgi:3'(2'), 5'-bisphosphate nucleotidase